MSEFPQDFTGPSDLSEFFGGFEGFGGLCSKAKADFPQGFKVPLDQGGPPLFCSPRVPIGGFGGDPDKNQAAHRATVRSVGKAPVVLIHGNSGSADLGRWSMLELRKNLMAEAGYQRELIWAPSYLGRNSLPISLPIGGLNLEGGVADISYPHAHNVGEVRDFIDNVCEYLDVEVVDIIAHSLGCTLAYSAFRGLKKQDDFFINSWSWDQPKKWHRVGTFVALAGAFRGLTGAPGEWTPGGPFMDQLLAEELVGGQDETPYDVEGEQETPSPEHKITYFCGIAENDYADDKSPDPDISTSMLKGANHKVYQYPGDELAKHEEIIKDPVLIHDIKDLLNSVPPVPRVAMMVNADSGDHDSPLTVTIDVDSPDKVVSYVANRVTKEVVNSYVVGKITSTVRGTSIGGQAKLALPTNGMWEVDYNVEGAVEADKKTYWVGTTEKIEVTIDTDNSAPFERSLDVTATTTRGNLYHSLSGGGQSQAVPLRGALSTVIYGEGWSEGDVAPIDRNAVVYFIAIDEQGTASEIVSRSFEKAAG
jgi:pimeloyl-ACP methyl ester carboxylesterase